MDSTQFLTYEELAAELSVNVRTVSRWVTAARRCTGRRLVLLPSEIVELGVNRFRIVRSALDRLCRADENDSKTKSVSRQVKDNKHAIAGIRDRLARKGLRPNF